MVSTLHPQPLRAHRVAPAAGALGGIVLLPGLRETDESVLELAHRLAAQRYLVMVPELVGSLGLDPEAAAAAEQTWHEVDHDDSVSDVLTLVKGPDYSRWAVRALRATVTALSREPGVDERIAVIGYGTGGGLAFTIASADPRVRLALAYDSVGTDIDLVENIKGAAVSFYAADNVAAAQSLPDLRAAMRRAGVPFCAKPYPARHLSLTDLVTPRPHGSVAGDLWQRSLAMLRLHLV